jgi:hypothetical protein
LQYFIAPGAHSGTMKSAVIDEAIEKEGDEAVAKKWQDSSP